MHYTVRDGKKEKKVKRSQKKFQHCGFLLHKIRQPSVGLYTKFEDWLSFFFPSWGLTTRQPLWVILCRLPEKGRREIEEIVER